MRNKRVCDYIAEAIQNEILSGRMSSGVPLRQEELADSLGYSRIPIREALQILESQGLAKRLATRHVVVADFSDEVITEIYELLSDVDAKLRAQMRVELAKLHKELKTTVIYVTHDQTEAMTLGTKIIVMKDGVVQQVDTPQNLYQKPGNLFVAGFMGSPQMNFLDAVISEKGGNLIAKVGEHELVIPAAKAKALKDGGYVGKTVVLGIRPEDIHDSQMFIEASPSAPMTSVVKVYELLGAEVFLYFDVNGTQVTARVDPRTTAKTGDPIKFAFDMEKSHFFDKETELTICN